MGLVCSVSAAKTSFDLGECLRKRLWPFRCGAVLSFSDECDCLRMFGCKLAHSSPSHFFCKDLRA